LSWNTAPRTSTFGVAYPFAKSESRLSILSMATETQTSEHPVGDVTDRPQLAARLSTPFVVPALS